MSAAKRCPPSKLNTKVPDRLGARLAGITRMRVWERVAWEGPGLGARGLCLLCFCSAVSLLRFEQISFLHWIAIFLTKK